MLLNWLFQLKLFWWDQSGTKVHIFKKYSKSQYLSLIIIYRWTRCSLHGFRLLEKLINLEHNVHFWPKLTLLAHHCTFIYMLKCYYLVSSILANSQCLDIYFNALCLSYRQTDRQTDRKTDSQTNDR